MSEEWRDVVGYEGRYLVSNTGKVKSVYRKEMIMKQYKTKGGYLRLELNMNKVSKKFTVHRLVAEAFLPNKKNKPEVNHKNGIKTDNRVENLEWSTSSENQRHAFDTGLQKGRKGTTHHSNKLNEEQVLEIRKLHEDGYKQVELAEIYGLHANYVNLIIKRRRWKHV